MPSRTSKFVEPATIEEAEERMLTLFCDIVTIEKDIKDKERRDRSGRVLDKDEYHQWKRSARTSLTYKKQEYAHLKAWLKRARREEAARRVRTKERITSATFLLKEIAKRYPNERTLQEELDHVVKELCPKHVA